MRITNVTARFLAPSLLLTFVGSVVAQSSSQDAPKNTWIRVTTVRVKPDMVSEWQEIYKNDIMPAYKKANVPGMGVWATSLFGNANEYALVVPITKFEQFDGDSPLVKSMKPEERVRVGNRLSKCIVSSQSEALLSVADTTIYKEGALPSLVMVTRTQLEPKNVTAYLSYLKEEMKPLMVKGGVDNWWVYRDVFGADHTQIVTVRGLKNWAEIDAGPIATRVLGPENAAKLSSRGNSLINSSSITMAHYVKDLSY